MKSSKEVVVLLHGLGRTPASMVPIAVAARRDGYRVINWHYASKRLSIVESAEAFAREVAPRLTGAPRVHFITHSLGGIVVRCFLATHALPNLGNVVMLAPPNGGSEVADRLQRGLLSRLMKPLRELGTGSASTPRSLPRPSFNLGIIAGSRSHLPCFGKWMHDAPNDGIVAVEYTKLSTMSDFLVLHRTHTFLPWSRDAIRAAMQFVARGRFSVS